MGTYNVHGGHNSIVPGAASILNEVTEDRKVKNELISLLKAADNTVYDCTDDKGTTQSKNLANIVAKCNAHSVDLDISIHLNSGRKDKSGDGKTGGVEVLICNIAVKDTAKKIADAIAEEFGYTLRSDSTTPSGYAGVKIVNNLYVLNHTKAKACLIECCFVDDKDDAKVWNAERCAAAIAKALTGKKISSGSSSGSGSTSSATHGGTSGHYWAKMQLYSSNQTDAQKWIVHKHSDGTYSFKNKACNLYMSVRDGKTENGSEIWVYSWNETKSQRFKIDPDENGDIAAEATIRSTLKDSMVVDVQSASNKNGAKIQLYGSNSTSAQKWNFIPAGGDEEYFIINSVSGKALDVVSGGK